MRFGIRSGSDASSWPLPRAPSFRCPGPGHASRSSATYELQLTAPARCMRYGRHPNGGGHATVPGARLAKQPPDLPAGVIVRDVSSPEGRYVDLTIRWGMAYRVELAVDRVLLSVAERTFK